MSICSFSGTHDWHPSVLNDTDAHEQDNADTIIWNINRGHCPRCERPLPLPPESPAGSRVTECRSIPICGRCGSDEAYESMDAACGRGWGLLSAGEWPLDVEEIDERRTRWESRTEVGMFAADDHLITARGVKSVVNPRNTGGWAQYGTAVEGDDDES